MRCRARTASSWNSTLLPASGTLAEPLRLCPTSRIRSTVLASGRRVAAIVVQHRERILKRRWKVAWLGRACDAGDGTQVLVDSLDLMVGHLRKHWPWHDLQTASVDGSWNAVRGGGSCGNGCTVWMEVIEICALPHDLLKLLKRVAPFRSPRLVRCQVAGNNVWTKITSKTWILETRGESLAESTQATVIFSNALTELRLRRLMP